MARFTPALLSFILFSFALALPGIVLFRWFEISGDGWLNQRGELILNLTLNSLGAATLALLISVPLSLCGAVYLTELASAKVQHPLRPLLGISAQFPPVLFGWLGSILLLPPMVSAFGDRGLFLSAAMALTLMLIPSLTLGFTKAMSSVSDSLRQAAFALGGSPLRTAFQVVIPSIRGPLTRRIAHAAARATGEGVVIVLILHSLPGTQNTDTLASWMLIQGGSDPIALWDVALALLALSACFTLWESFISQGESHP